jgi:hypothetical protein
VRLHVLAGCRELLQPAFLAPEMPAGLIGPHVRVATAFWVSPKCGNNYHTFLQDEPGDCRTRTMALALKDGFATRFEPLLVLADLLNEVKSDEQRALPATVADRRSQLTVLSEILACGHVRQLQLYGLALPAKADPDGSWAVPAGIVPGTIRDRIEKLRVTAVDMGPDAVGTRVIEATSDLPVFSTLYNNSLCNQLVLRLAPRLREQGWTCDPEILAAAIFRILAYWNREGIFLTLPLRADHLDAMTELVYEKVL